MRARGVGIVLSVFSFVALHRPPVYPQSMDRTPANRLSHESSPYLLLHADNPVDWYPWGDEAIERAQREDKPIFLSIGYSTCYWCHVMEREVFSDPKIAELMNQWFVNIKVDREERPDLDDIYMVATQLMTRTSGGWPNSIFLTPGLEPFFAGTYFPPEDRGFLRGFPTVMSGVREAWETGRPEIEATAERISTAIRTIVAKRRQPGELPSTAVVDRAISHLKGRFDEANGGFSDAPKFPSPADLFLLWDRAVASGNAEARRMVLETLHKMGRGAIYDQLAGGFHRYTLDAEWRVPHFEKMLYDNALLAELLSVTAQATDDPELERIAHGTLDFVLREMQLPDGGFESAIDAETDGEEGAYYLWTRDELRSVLGEEGYDLLAPILGFDGPPNFEGERYTLYLTDSLTEHARQRGWTRRDLLIKMDSQLERLRQARSSRELPLVDDKVLTDWNGMMIATLARAGLALGEPRYLQA
ncbi:MAG: thioredoxin domain-containing protein, partial [Vicinamibacteria bacterium]